MQKQKKRQRLDRKQQRGPKLQREGGRGGLQSGPRGRVRWLRSLHLRGWPESPGICRPPGPPQQGHALAYHPALRANALQDPSECTEVSRLSQAPASPRPAPSVAQKFSLNFLR